MESKTLTDNVEPQLLAIVVDGLNQRHQEARSVAFRHLHMLVDGFEYRRIFRLAGHFYDGDADARLLGLLRHAVVFRPDHQIVLGVHLEAFGRINDAGVRINAELFRFAAAGFDRIRDPAVLANVLIGGQYLGEEEKRIGVVRKWISNIHADLV